MGGGPAIAAAVRDLVVPSDRQEQKLKKIYSAVMLLENTDFTRQHTNQAEYTAGLKEAAQAEDSLIRKRGTGDQLTQLFVTMAHTAGLKAYLMAVANRNGRIFLPAYLSMRQFDDYIAVVNVDGKEVYLDPGQRVCAFGQSTWKHTLTGGLR